MLTLIRRSLVPCLLVVGCGGTVSHHPTSVAEHERKARSYEATADSIEVECMKDRRHELTVDLPAACWKAQDIRFLEANRNAALAHRAEATRLRAVEANTSRTATR
jgi:hypothetical protein